MKLTSARIDYLYDLMDAAYDAQPIYAVSRGDNVMVRGAQNVGLHLMFGVIVLFADQLLKLIS